ncbi:V-type K -independent H -translocating inorganic pyrophosphatase [Plasmodium brasilianum]|uniref:H(+)-exporting diphosphatase n=2 Tax=Plasmodium (Plasmodium) TaxID=418103 RepID=A0A1A8WDU2_PLAMA|nr:V-type K+-independent H+-translocating inorganic pyrophosphatase, putative [Plasmodium malariae]KAI4835058.1 V-type K -independent H -translocating inorganic pyrophosphatase [Plasmodium brasilianum]SBS91149.1 V-type K+-independent H+-translocating inorganic pyrophosphatase (VP2) [Plasmodium malariae]SCP03634.1 V-type K+-independent H+-translocating inorganic pyrophosphatase, putative [Plasmodium malariae]
MLPLHEKTLNGKTRKYKNLTHSNDNKCSKSFFTNDKTRNVYKENIKRDYRKSRATLDATCAIAPGEEMEDEVEEKEDLKVIKFLKIYINKSAKQRILINTIILFLFLLIVYISFLRIDNIRTVYLIGLALYSIYFLLFSLYMLSTILNDEYEVYNTVKRDDLMSDNITHERQLNILNKNEVANSQQMNRHGNALSHGYGASIPLKDSQYRIKHKLEEKNYTKGRDAVEGTNPSSPVKGSAHEQGIPTNRSSYRSISMSENGNDKKKSPHGKNIVEVRKGGNTKRAGACNEGVGESNEDSEAFEGYDMFTFDSIAKPIREGAEGFFAVQYNSIFRISLLFSLLIFLLYIMRGDYTKLPQEKSVRMKHVSDKSVVISPCAYGLITAVSFLLGAICSSIAGYNGIYVAVRANVKVAKAATYSYNKALITCFRSGAVSAIVNVSLAILGICILLLFVSVLYPSLAFTKHPLLIVGYGFGASLVAMLYQLAGGIYTKAADIGADLVGKIERHIPEDDARNPAVIADLVGDNVGDCAGQCADLFESISAEIIASMILGGNLCVNGIISEKSASYFVLFPLFVHSMDLLVSTIGVYLVYTSSNDEWNGSKRNREAYYKGANEKIEKVEKAKKADKAEYGKKHTYSSNDIKTCFYEKSRATKNMNSKEVDLLLCENYADDHDHYDQFDYNYEYDDKIKSENLESPLKVMLKAYFFICLLSITGFSLLCRILFSLDEERGKNYTWAYFSLCGLVGMTCSYLFVILTRYYTDYSYPKVKKIAHASLSGPATNIIAGLYVGLESTFFPVIVISISLLLSYYLGIKGNITGDSGVINGLYGTSVATMGMLSTAVFILSMSNFGPIADNAGGIVEMSKQPEYVRIITDKLDAVGNVTKANTKGFSVGSAALACFLLFSAFLSEVSIYSKTPLQTVDIAIPEVFIGGILGSVVVFLFAAWSLDAVGNTAEEVLNEVRRQFNEHPGILTYKEKPDYHTCVAIISRRALSETVKPGLLGIFAPIIVGMLFKYIGFLQNNQLLGAQVIASFIMFSTSTGILMALFLNNAGGAWDNAKKYIESGFYGGKNSPAHVSSVIGDTVGDPCKDTAGPSIHVLIKLISTITMVMTPLIASTATE